MSVINYVFVDPIFISIQSLDIANFYEYIWKYMQDAQASPNGLRANFKREWSNKEDNNISLWFRDVCCLLTDQYVNCSLSISRHSIFYYSVTNVICDTRSWTRVRIIEPSLDRPLQISNFHLIIILFWITYVRESKFLFF